METIFMGMISIKYQLTWEPQPGVQCVKGKCTSHFHKARSAGKKGLLRFALIMHFGIEVTFVAFNQATWIGPNSNFQSGSSTRLVLVPWAAPACPEAQKPRPTSEGLLQGPGRESFAPQSPGSGLPASPRPHPQVYGFAVPPPCRPWPAFPGPGGTASPWQCGFMGPL